MLTKFGFAVGAVAACTALLIAQPLAVRAQGPGGPPHMGMGRPGGWGGFGRPGGGRMQFMAQALGLTPQQQAKMQAINHAMQQEEEAKINAILTPAQRQKWAAMRAQMHQRGPGGPGRP